MYLSRSFVRFNPALAENGGLLVDNKGYYDENDDDDQVYYYREKNSVEFVLLGGKSGRVRSWPR
jgi:hypothetical protein